MDEALLSLLTGENRSPSQPSGRELAFPAQRPLLLVILGPYAAAQAMLTLAAHLALRGPLQVLDGGNRFNAYIVARQLRRLSLPSLRQGTVDPASKAPDLRQCLDRIQVARAFTCYQMAALIDQTTLTGSPTLVIDLLDTFYDESAPLAERRRLAEHCMQQLRQSTLSVPRGQALVKPGQALVTPGQAVVVSLRPPPPGQPDPTGLQDLVQAAADHVLIQDGPAPKQARSWRYHPDQDRSWPSQDKQPELF